jgi:hypothetical protein
MRRLLTGAIFVVGLVSPIVSNANAIHMGDLRPVGPAAVDQVQYSGYCERLRRACIYKHERGEAGEGNCRRYRAECGGRSSYCERLRRACVFKEERGEVGEGNCRRYRAECGRRD